VQFKVTHWPKKDYGQFYTGDSYIILNTYKKDPSSRVSCFVSMRCLGLIQDFKGKLASLIFLAGETGTDKIIGL
jgi:hypothetical protein